MSPCGMLWSIMGIALGMFVFTMFVIPELKYMFRLYKKRIRNILVGTIGSAIFIGGTAAFAFAYENPVYECKAPKN